MRLFVDNLTNVDFSYLCPERGLLGETWLAHIELEGELDEQGMVCDFGIVKKQLRHWLDTEIDHRLLVPTEYAGCKRNDGDDASSLSFTLNSGEAITTSGPKQAVTYIPACTVTPESVARFCENELREAFGEGVAKVTLSFTPEVIDTPFYHYSHGLKKHAGNCQRIAHGHRSKILIWQDGELSAPLIRHWADVFSDIYLATEEDICGETDTHWQFSYQAQQGEFSLSLPKTQVYLMDTDTTVEFIAQHIAVKLKEQMPEHRFTVKAFEGIAKGAIADV